VGICTGGGGRAAGVANATANADFLIKSLVSGVKVLATSQS
jgi:hypothetical protein